MQLLLASENKKDTECSSNCIKLKANAEIEEKKRATMEPKFGTTT